MPIPSQTDMNHVVLELMQDGKSRSRATIRDDVLTMLSLTDAERAEKTSSGKPVYASRVDWSISYLDRAQLLDRISRGVYEVNQEGREVYAAGIDGSELFQTINKRIAERDPWHITKKPKTTSNKTGGDGTDGGEPTVGPAVKSPQEQMGDLADEMNDVLGSELLQLIMDRDPSFFEKVVVELIAAMGYGKGEVTSRSHDGGIDGLVTTDELGFRPIYTQAKRYGKGNTVGRPTLQSFVGALNGARNGVFITTSSFTKEAEIYARNYPNATISLIDGHRLTELMIKYNLGVATESVIEIKRVDSDYFEDV